MSYKKITIEYENGYVREIKEPIALKVWTWDDVQSLMEDYIFEPDDEDLSIREVMSIVKQYMNVFLVREYLEMCTDAEWDILENQAYKAFEENR